MNSPNIIIFEDTSFDVEKEEIKANAKVGSNGSLTKLNRVKLDKMENARKGKVNYLRLK
jgi:hypothetical protein